MIEEENLILEERLIKLDYHQHCSKLLFDGFVESRNEMDRDFYELIKHALSNMYSNDENAKKGNGLTKFEKASKISIALIHQY